MVPLATSASHSGVLADQLSSPSSTTFKSIFSVPAAVHPPHPSSSTHSMGQVASRPQVTTLSPSSAPSSLGIPGSNTGTRFKRALAGRRKKSDTIAPPSPGLDKGKEPQIGKSLHASAGTPSRPLGAKQLTLQLAQHVFNKKSASASPAMSGLSLPPPPPPKHVHQPVSSSRPTPLNTNVDRRISIMTTSSPIVPALDYMKKSEEPLDQTALKENERNERLEAKDVRRKSDSTLSLHTIRPSLGSRTPRPVSLAESLHSTHTIVPMNKRLSALITDAEYVMAEEEGGSRNDEKGRAFSRPSPASSLRLRDRRSQSLNLGPPLSLMVSGSTVSNATMSLETITVTLPRSASEGCERERHATKEMATMTFSSLPSDTTREVAMRHASAISSLNQAYRSAPSRAERTLPKLPDPLQNAMLPPQGDSSQPSFRQTAISMTSGFAPAAGLARRAVEKMGRVWGSKSSVSSPLASPLGEPSFNGRTGPPSRANSSHSESVYHGYGRKVRHNPQTPSVSSTASSLSDQEGPQLGRCLRGPIRPSGAGGLVFGRDLKTCVEETSIDSILSALRVQSSGREVLDTLERVRWKQPPVPVESRHVPALVVRCAQHILAWGVQEQGLFRVNGRSSHIAKLRAEFDTGADFDIAQCNPGDLDPHAVASVFKAYLRELPEPILTSQLMPYFDAAMASERLTNNIQDPPLSNIQGLRKPPSLSTLGMPNFGGSHPPSELLRKALSTLISRLPQENRDLLLTVTEVINSTAKRSSETKMPLSNLLLVLCPSLSMNPSLLQALCESQGIWHGVHRHQGSDLDANAGGINQSSLHFSEEGAETGNTVGTNEVASHSRPPDKSRRFVRPLPSIPTANEPTSISSSAQTPEPLGPRIIKHDTASQLPLDAEILSPSFSATDDSSSISHSSQSGRPVTPTSLNFKLTNPYTPPSLSCSTDSLSVPSLSSGSPLIKSLGLVDEYGEQLSSNSPRSPDIAEPIPVPIPTLRPTQTSREPQFQFPGSRDSVIRNPIMHRKSTPSISFSSSGSAEAQSASVASRARRLKKPSLHLLFSKHPPPPVSIPTPQTPAVTGTLASSASESSLDSMVTAPQSSRFSYPPILNTAIDESSISLALGIQDNEEGRASSTKLATKNDVTNLQRSMVSGTAPHYSPPGECSEDTEFRRLDVTLPEEEQIGGYDWTQSVLMAAGEPGW